MKLKKRIDKVVSVMVMALMAIMTIDVIWQVFARKVLQNPSQVTDELATFLLIWTGLLGAAYVTGQKMHLAIDLLPSKLTGKKAKRLNQFIQITIILFSVIVMVIGGANLVYVTLLLEQTSPSLNIPLGYVYLVLPLSGLLIIYYSVYHWIYFEEPSTDNIHGVD